LGRRKKRKETKKKRKEKRERKERRGRIRFHSPSFPLSSLSLFPFSHDRLTETRMEKVKGKSIKEEKRKEFEKV